MGKQSKQPGRATCDVHAALNATPSDVSRDDRVRIAFAVFDGIGDAGAELGSSRASLHPPETDKAFQTLRACLALAGHTLSRTDSSDGPCSYFVSRWGMVRELRDIDAVRAFARQVGVTHG